MNETVKDLFEESSAELAAHARWSPECRSLLPDGADHVICPDYRAHLAAARFFELCRARDAVCAFVSAPIRCKGCESGAPIVGVFDLVDPWGVCDRPEDCERVPYCRDCFELVKRGGADVEIRVSRGNLRLIGDVGAVDVDALLGWLVVAVILLGLALGATVAP